MWEDMNLFVTFDDLLQGDLSSKEMTIKWLMDEKLLASQQKCQRCGENMSLEECDD